jgi:hypothetical protein
MSIRRKVRTVTIDRSPVQVEVGLTDEGRFFCELSTHADYRDQIYRGCYGSGDTVEEAMSDFARQATWTVFHP